MTLPTGPTTTARHRILIVNCYPEASRLNFDRQDVGHPHDLFRDVLAREAPNAAVDLVFIADPGFALPEGRTIADYDGVIWTGSDLRLGDTDDPRVIAQLSFARELLAAGTACWGSCWGIQLASVVAGGAIDVNPRGREWGIARGISVTDAGSAAAMYDGKPARFDAFIMHLDEVTSLPDGTALLATNEHTHVQAAIIGSYWATQYHPEYNLLEMGRLIAARASALVAEGFFPDEAAVASYAAAMKALHADPDSVELREQLGVGEDIIDARIRETELRNWLRFVDARAG